MLSVYSKRFDRTCLPKILSSIFFVCSISQCFRYLRRRQCFNGMRDNIFKMESMWWNALDILNVNAFCILYLPSSINRKLFCRILHRIAQTTHMSEVFKVSSFCVSRNQNTDWNYLLIDASIRWPMFHTKNVTFPWYVQSACVCETAARNNLNRKVFKWHQKGISM